MSLSCVSQQNNVVAICIISRKAKIFESKDVLLYFHCVGVFVSNKSVASETRDENVFMQIKPRPKYT